MEESSSDNNNQTENKTANTGKNAKPPTIKDLDPSSPKYLFMMLFFIFGGLTLLCSPIGLAGSLILRDSQYASYLWAIGFGIILLIFGYILLKQQKKDFILATKDKQRLSDIAKQESANIPAYIPKGEVTFSPVPNNVNFPQYCIYCMQPSDRYENLEVSATHRGRNVKYTGRMSLSRIPYCFQHAEEVQTLRKLQYVIWGAVGLAGISMYIFTPKIHILIALGILFAVWLITSFAIQSRYPNFGKYGGKGVLTSDNIILGLQVIPSIYTNQGYLYSGGITRITLIFHNTEYAKLFAKENGTFSI